MQYRVFLPAGIVFLHGRAILMHELNREAGAVQRTTTGYMGMDTRRKEGSYA
jgi:hypothetical protein